MHHDLSAFIKLYFFKQNVCYQISLKEIAVSEKSILPPMQQINFRKE